MTETIQVVSDNLDVSIVIVSWKMRDLLHKMLSTIYANTKDVTFEVIVVDNSSNDGTAEMVKKNFPSASLIQNPTNRGVGPARNTAFRIARGKYIASFDADMLFLENSIKIMKDFMDRYPSIGLCGCKLVFDNNLVQFSARSYPSLIAQICRRLRWIPMVRNSKILIDHEMKEWNRTDDRAVDYVIGACHFIRRKAMDEVGLYDERIFYGPEDTDYCLRMNKSAWQVYFCSQTSIIHKEQRVTRKKLFSKLTVAHLFGIIYFYKKHGWKIEHHIDL